MDVYARTGILRKTLALMVLGGMCFASDPSWAGPPVLIEFFGNSYRCTANKTVEREIEELLAAYPDAILLNCRVENSPRIPDKEAFGRPYCNEGRIGYFQEMGLFSMATPMVIINGRYDANNTKLETALKLGLSMDETRRIDVSAAAGGLNIRVPADAGTRGVLYLYTYASFEKSPDARVGGGRAIKPKAALRIGESVFAGDKPFRPVVHREKIANWSGGALEFTYPIKPDAFPDYAGANLGYVVVLHEGGLFSPVLAAGELSAELVLYSGAGEEPLPPLTEPVLPFDVPADVNVSQRPPS